MIDLNMTPEEKKLVEEASRRVDQEKRLAKREELAIMLYLEMMKHVISDYLPNPEYYEKTANNAVVAAEALLKALERSQL